METINETLIEALQNLSGLELTEGEKSRSAEELTRVLEFFRQMNAVDTEGVEPLTHFSENSNVLREDLVIHAPHVEELLENAPSVKDGMYCVPRTFSQTMEAGVKNGFAKGNRCRV